jgi:hypothetical protein
MNDLIIIKYEEKARKIYTAEFLMSRVSTEDSFIYHFFEDVRNDSEVLFKPKWTYFEYKSPEKRSELLKILNAGDKVSFLAYIKQGTQFNEGFEFEDVEFIKKI